MQFDFEDIYIDFCGEAIGPISGTVEFTREDSTWEIDAIICDPHPDLPDSARRVHYAYSWQDTGTKRGVFLALKAEIEDAYAERIASENSFLPQEAPYRPVVL